MTSGSYDFYWTHALISDEVHQGIVLNCNFSAEASTSVACDEYTSEADSCQANIYDYNTYSQLCNSSAYTSLPIDGFDPCTPDYVDNYLNTAEVQKALNVRDIPHSWESCSGYIHGFWQDSPDTVLPIFQELMQSGIRVWIYSGDVDHILAVTTSRYAIDKIKTPIKTPWYPWFFQGEVGGYAVEYQNLTFVTVRGAGHFVPSYQPGRALTMFSSFINGTLPPGEVDVLREFLKARRAKARIINLGLEPAEKQRSASKFIVPQVGSKENDKISALPGQPSGVNFAQYSGYVTVDANAGRALFYYLAESSNDPPTKPLVLWLNGGPGCSSFGNGGMVELGPFRVNKDGKTLSRNPFAWNNVANVLFLESPAGVGFSYSNTSSDYHTGDEKTRQDSFTFLVNWMERFPEYKHRDFYIAGESYAGHYVPQLAQLILSHKKTEPNLVINLQGIATGNALLDDETMNSGSYDFYWTHALISDEVHQGIVSNCNFSAEASTSEACDEYTSEADSCQANIYDYNTYSQLCNSSAYFSHPIDGFDPCSADYVFNYLNTAEIQKALNVRDVPHSWESCSYIGAFWQDSPNTVLPIVQELMQSGIRVWIYSGDIDHILPVTTSRYAIDKIKTPIKTPWYPWFFQGEVGGYAVEYQNLTFATIKFHVAVLDLDVALYSEKPTVITEASSDEEKSYYNRLGLMFMQMNIVGNIKITLFKTESAKEPLKLVKESSQTADKSLAGTLMGTLTTMKFDSSRTMHKHVIEMINIARLKSLGMKVEHNFLVQFIINSLLFEISSKAVSKTPFELWTGKKPNLRHLYVWGCPTKFRVYNPQEKNLDSRTINDFFIGYPKKSKGYRFYCPNYSIRIVETENARFIENGEVSGSEEPRNVEIKEVRVRIPLSCTSFKFVAPEAVVQQSNQQEQQINVPINHNEAIIDEPVVDEQQEVASRRSQRPKKSASFDDYLVYLHESETDLEIDDDPVSFSQAIESNSSDK
ncbi:Serine carboxypeptidase-like 40 [Capsicum chinense]|nr:Serine carboxypeptidase-like 40 [Capsicum chinense]